ncbi:glutaminase A [Streptomyces sp. NBC_01092]|uniref:glutaminase A n=1 Tax=Streptomyces sp. NBC_01092 TaxID=2903748 RepID=UPI00386BC391|nr:glutaminase A [Streptomyces sp. NBC_01092]
MGSSYEVEDMTKNTASSLSIRQAETKKTRNMSSAPQEVDRPAIRQLFDSFKKDAEGNVSRMEVLSRLERAGILPDDPRVDHALKAVAESSPDGPNLNLDRFAKLCQQSGGLLERSITGALVIPDFVSFTNSITEIYTDLLGEKRGAVADYIPQLKRVSPDRFGIAVCTVDGQRFSIGDAGVEFCVQSVCKPVNYSLTLDEHSADIVHRHVGREPSGRKFNELSVNGDGLPHNPMINSGAIMSCSLIKRSFDMADRFDFVADTWRRLAAGGPVGFNNSVYLSERQTADRNFALGYFMRESGAFPDGTDLVETLEFYFQCCSIELDARGLASVASTFANGGVVPLSNDRVFASDSVKKCLSLMSSCGMYDYSGEFAFHIGLPAKSGVSGALMLVIPQVMGIAIWAPPLDSLGNSVRGIEFCRKLVGRYTFHIYDSLTAENCGKQDPRLKRNQSVMDTTIRLLWSASAGDLEGVRAALASGVSANACDYDGRTALHLAAAEGHVEVATHLLERGAEAQAVDRWGGTALTDAENGGHGAIVKLLRHGAPTGEPPPVSLTSETA